MAEGKNYAVVGAFAGDEGKGKIVDVLAKEVDYVVRCEGGANAGHTIQVGDFTFVGHLLPSGAAQGKTCVLGRGVRVDLPQLFSELDAFSSSGRELPVVLVDEGAFLSLPWHKALEWWVEHYKGKGGRAAYSTMRGMAPIAATTALRLNIQVGLLFHPDDLMGWLDDFYQSFHPIFKHRDLVDAIGEVDPPDRLAAELLGYRERLKPLVADTRARLSMAWKSGQRILFEGAQGLMLDPHWGTYGYNTSGICTFAGLSQGCGLPFTALGRRIGVAKAYATRVGNGPFPSELGFPTLLKSEQKIPPDEETNFLYRLRERINAGEANESEVGQYLRVRGHEYGATTGRPRRTGWFDGAWQEYFVAVNDPHELALTKLDCLSGIKLLKVVCGYRLNRQLLPTGTVPAFADDFARVLPVYDILSGWEENITGETTWERLPLCARNFVEYVEGLFRCPITLIGTGPERDHVIQRNP